MKEVRPMFRVSLPVNRHFVRDYANCLTRHSLNIATVNAAANLISAIIVGKDSKKEAAKLMIFLLALRADIDEVRFDTELIKQAHEEGVGFYSEEELYS